MSTAQLNAKAAAAWQTYCEATLLPLIRAAAPIRWEEFHGMRLRVITWSPDRAAAVLRESRHTDWCATEVTHPDRLDIVCMDPFRLMAD